MAPTNKGVVIVEKGKVEVKDLPIPTELKDGWIVVKVRAVAINPTDWKHIDGLATPGVLVGCDYAGVVEELGGGDVNGLKKGDRVAGLAHGSNKLNPKTGTFTNFALVSAAMSFKIPDSVSDSDAATLPLAFVTVGQGLYQSLKLPLPNDPAKTPFPLLIYGGSTAMGVTGIQYAKLSGLTVVATASPHNFDYVRSLGADAVFDYRSPTAAADIRAFTNGELHHAWDTIGSEDSARLAAGALASEGPRKYSTLIAVKQEVLDSVSKGIELERTLAYTATGEDLVFGQAQIPASKEDFEFAKKFLALSEELVAEGKVKAIKTTVNEGGKGLEGVVVGLDLLRKGKVSASKLVYTLDD